MPCGIIVPLGLNRTRLIGAPALRAWRAAAAGLFRSLCSSRPRRSSTATPIAAHRVSACAGWMASRSKGTRSVVALVSALMTMLILAAAQASARRLGWAGTNINSGSAWCVRRGRACHEHCVARTSCDCNAPSNSSRTGSMKTERLWTALERTKTSVRCWFSTAATRCTRNWP